MRYPKIKISALVVAMSSAGVAFAQQASPTPPSGTMDHQQMMQGGSGGMPMTGMMREMSAMMENCSKMMQSMMNPPNQGNPAQPQQAPQGNRG